MMVSRGSKRVSRRFFFAAEDGIRDADVTGVQTCALPIFVEGVRREPSFPAHPLHDVDGRNIDVAIRPAVVCLAGEDGRDVPIQCLIVERLPAADLVGIAAEPGGKLMIHGWTPWAWVSAQRSAALKPCPSARPGVQPEWAASRGTGCTEREAWRKLGGSRSEGRQGQRPKPLVVVKASASRR